MKKDNKSLNTILESYQSLEMQIVENDGVVDNDIEQLLDINESDLKDKLDGYQGFIKYLEGQVNYLKVMESHYIKRRKVLEKSMLKKHAFLCRNARPMTSKLCQKYVRLCQNVSSYAKSCHNMPNYAK